ncbi:monocarboxylate transporter 13-like [Glandiceps talaboti]
MEQYNELERMEIQTSSTYRSRPRARSLLQIIRGGGWGLMIVLSAGTTDALISTFGYGMSPLFLELRSQFKSTAEETSWVLSLQYISFVFAFIGTFLARAIGARKTVMISGAVAAIGTFVSSFATSIYFLYVTLGLVTGLGFAGSYSPAQVTNKKYFPKEKEFDLVNRIAMLVPGVALFIFPPITQACVDQFGWRGALLVESAVIANLCVCGALLRPVSKNLRSREEEIELRETATNVPESRREQKQSLSKRFSALCCSPIFVMYLISVLFVALTVSGATMHLQSRATEAQVGTLQQTAFLVSISGICSLVGRFFSIFLGNWLKFSCITTYILSVFVIGIACFIPQLAYTYTGFAILSGLLGLGSGMCFSVFFSCASYLVSPEKQTTNQQLDAEVDQVEAKAEVDDSFAMVMLFFGIGLVIGAPVAGRVYDATNNYDYAYFVFGAFGLLSGVILVPGYIWTKVNKKRKGKEDETQNVEEE